jgi:hypothetical protein
MYGKFQAFMIAVGVMITIGCILNFSVNPPLAFIGIICGVVVILRSWKGLL